MMNVLVFDWDGSIGSLVRAALAAGGRRVSLESNPETARLKLETGLFDALVIGPAGMPMELADTVETDWPAMPIVLAGVERELPAEGRVVAVLAKPLSMERLAWAVRRVEQRLDEQARRTYDMPVDVIAGEQRVACRVVRLSKGSVLLAPEGAATAVEGPLSIRRGALSVDADIAFRDRGWLALRVPAEAISRLAVSDAAGGVELLEVGDAQGDARPPDDGGVSDL